MVIPSFVICHHILSTRSSDPVVMLEQREIAFSLLELAETLV